MSQGRAAAFLGPAPYNMDAAMVMEISDFKARCEPTTEDLNHITEWAQDLISQNKKS